MADFIVEVNMVLHQINLKNIEGRYRRKTMDWQTLSLRSTLSDSLRQQRRRE